MREVLEFEGIESIEIKDISGFLHILEIEESDSIQTEVHVTSDDHLDKLKIGSNEKGILSISSTQDFQQSFGNVNVYGNGNVVINGKTISTFSSPQYKIMVRVPKNKIKKIINKSAMDVKSDMGHPYEVHMIGSGDFLVNGAKEISCVLNGSGDLNIINVPIVRVAASGSGDVNISYADKIEVETKGSGDIAILGLEVHLVEAKMKGSGDLKILPLVHQLNVEAKGSGDITLKNSVIRENLNIKGSGRVRRKG